MAKLLLIYVRKHPSSSITHRPASMYINKCTYRLCICGEEGAYGQSAGSSVQAQLSCFVQCISFGTRSGIDKQACAASTQQATHASRRRRGNHPTCRKVNSMSQLLWLKLLSLCAHTHTDVTRKHTLTWEYYFEGNAK